MRTPPAPTNIRQEARKLWREVYQGFDLDAEGKATLTVAVISLSRFLDAREQLDKHGLTFTTQSGQVKKHPLVEVEKISRAGFLASMAALGLQWSEEEEKRRPGRPPGLGS